MGYLLIIQILMFVEKLKKFAFFSYKIAEMGPIIEWLLVSFDQKLEKNVYQNSKIKFPKAKKVVKHLK